jgi:hypothetical protein
MRSSDFAIVVGLPRSAPAVPDAAAEIRRVAGDAAAMRAWLLNPAGGRLAPDCLHCIAPLPGALAAGRATTRPLLAHLEAALAELEAQSRRYLAAGHGPRVGRRLTLYMSGQACLPGRYRPGTPARPGAPLLANAWLAWAQLSGMFHEVVLWLDCGQDHPAYLGRREPPPLASGPLGIGPGMVALAARRPFQPAVIQPAQALAPPQGALTWALLEGVRGAAADRHGQVTGRSMADWLRHAQSARLPEDAEPSLAREPEVIQADAALLLAEGVTAPHYPVRLRLPVAARGLPVRLWHGAPARLDRGLGLGQAVLDLALPPGLYLAEVPGAGLRQGFEVTGPTELALAQPGPPVLAEAFGQSLLLTLRAADPTLACAVVDHGFALARRGVGGLAAKLPFGLYKLRSRQGRTLSDRVLLLDRETTLALGAAPASPAAALAPLLPPGDQGAVLRLAGPARPGVSVVDMHGLTVLDLAYDGEPLPGDTAGEERVACAIALPPGGYFLRRRLGASRAGAAPVMEQSLVLVAGWALDVSVPPMLPAAMPPPVGLLMRPLAGPAPSAEQDALVAAMTVALADRRRILTPALEAALTGRVVDPLAGILAGHLLLLDQEYDPGRDLSALNGLVRQLRQLLGPLHPDVKALALRCPDATLRPSRPVPVLPMFMRSWRLLVAASHSRRALLPRRLWERAMARTAQSPFLAWSMDGRQRQAVQRELAEATWGTTATLAGSAPPMGNVVPFARAVPVKSDRGAARRRALLLDVPLSALELLAEVYEDNAGD